MNLNKRILIGSTANGIIKYWIKGAPVPWQALPFHSVALPREAESLIVLHCKLSRADNNTYFVPGIDGKFEDLEKLAELFRGQNDQS